MYRHHATIGSRNDARPLAGGVFCHAAFVGIAVGRPDLVAGSAPFPWVSVTLSPHSQYPSPQRYCQAMPTALNSLPVRVEMPVLAESFSEFWRSTGRTRVNPARVFRCSLSRFTPFRLV